MSSALIADSALKNQYLAIGSPAIAQMHWEQYEILVRSMRQSIRGWPALKRFTYRHPIELQADAFSVGKEYTVPIAYSDLEGDGLPLVAIGGLINVAQRFDFLAMDIAPEIRAIGLDLSGRGHSGWMMEISDYTIETYIEQLRQFLDYMEFKSCALLGSSLGGSTAIAFAARYPHRVSRIVLNDSTPYIPQERRKRRAAAVARHYVFNSPEQLFRRTGIATKHKGPVTDAAALHYADSVTRWSDNENGRIYRHDLRALLAYRAQANQSLDIWDQWEQVRCPILLLHGAESDATLPESIDRMRYNKSLSVIHVHKTGHTPSLSDGILNEHIVQWLLDDWPFDQDLEYEPVTNWTKVLYAANA